MLQRGGASAGWKLIGNTLTGQHVSPIMTISHSLGETSLQYNELSEQQSRLAIDIAQLYDAYSETLRHLAEIKGTFVWKVLRGKTYLFKKLDAKGNGRVIALRSPETEAMLQAARRRKAEVKERESVLRARLAEQARLAKALRIARVPKAVSAVLRVLNRSGLLGRNVIVVGTHALYAYEAGAGVRFDSSVMETTDVDILWEARSRLTLAADVRGAGLIGLLRQADRSFERASARSFRAVNREGFMVDLLKPLRKDVIRDDSRKTIGGEDDLFAVEARNLAWLLSAKKFHQTAVGQDGFPVPFVAPDPRLFALHKFWLAEQADRDPVKKRRDRAQGEAVLKLVLERLPQYPLDPQVLKGLPVAARTPRMDVPEHL